MRGALVGVVGHVDHGKTALVKALTGTDTDRLKEERERGISIALGFAGLTLPGAEIDLIDMPGHERFVRTMVSGATGMEAVLAVVAADEGIRPQTLEHLEIAALVGARRGVVAVTRCDLVPEEVALRTAAEAVSLCERLAIAAAPAVLTSVVTGQGIAALADRLGALARPAGASADHGFALLPVDRAFAAAGFGTVVTGTLRRGALSVGDELETAPGGRRTRVRGLQIHGRPVQRAEPGRRTAVNLRGLGRDEMPRGVSLATPGVLVPSRRVDAALTALADAGRALADGSVLRLLFATTEVEARLRLLDRDALGPGESAVVQLRCAQEVFAVAGEPFILRTASPPRTVGGGRLLDPEPPRRRRQNGRDVDLLRALAAAEPLAAAGRHLLDAGAQGCDAAGLARRIGFAPGWLQARLDGAEAAVLPDGRLLHRTVLRRLEERALTLVGAHQSARPTDPGMPAEALRAGLAADTADAVVAGLVARGALRRDGGALRRPDLDPARLLSPADQRLLGHVETAFRRGGLAPPDAAAVGMGDPRCLRAVRYLIRTGALVRTIDRVQKREILFHRDSLARARRILALHLSDRGGFTVGEVGRLLGVSRRFTVPLLEHLDAVGFTRRDGDQRVIAERRTPDAPPADARPRDRE